MISVPVTPHNKDIFLQLKELDKQFQQCESAFLKLSLIIKANKLCESLELESQF